MKKFILLLISLLTIFIDANSSELKNDTITTCVYFRLAKSYIDPDFRDNATQLNVLRKNVESTSAPDSIDKIIIEAFASPDGPLHVNDWLSRARCKSLSDYIVRELGVPAGIIETRPGGVAWERLRQIVTSDSTIPYREEILKTLDFPVQIFNSKGEWIDGRKKRLMDLRGGRPFRYLYDNIFPDLRSSISVTVVCRRIVPEPVVEEIATETVETAIADETPTDTVVTVTIPEQQPEPVIKREPLHRLAIKTNLLYDAALMPNIEIGYRIDERWSVSAEADVAWWKNDPQHKYYQVMYLGAEGRYWFKTRKPWHGHFVGVFSGGGKFDLENGGRGYKGEGGMAGISYGYMFPISRNLSFEAEIGAGYLYAVHSEYLPRDGHYLFQHKSRTHYFGPLKVKFSIVWRLFDNNRLKKGGVK